MYTCLSTHLREAKDCVNCIAFMHHLDIARTEFPRQKEIKEGSIYSIYVTKGMNPGIIQMYVYRSRTT